MWLGMFALSGLAGMRECGEVGRVRRRMRGGEGGKEMENVKEGIKKEGGKEKVALAGPI